MTTFFVNFDIVFFGSVPILRVVIKHISLLEFALLSVGIVILTLLAIVVVILVLFLTAILHHHESLLLEGCRLFYNHRLGMLGHLSSWICDKIAILIWQICLILLIFIITAGFDYSWCSFDATFDHLMTWQRPILGNFHLIIEQIV